MPVRLRLSRAKGFNLQEHSRAVNGLDAVKVDRSTGYGNPFVVGEFPSLALSAYTTARVGTADEAVQLFRVLLINSALHIDATVDALIGLRGKNLACWCALDAPCHADVLLELANKPVCEAVNP